MSIVCGRARHLIVEPLLRRHEAEPNVAHHWLDWQHHLLFKTAELPLDEADAFQDCLLWECLQKWEGVQAVMNCQLDKLVKELQDKGFNPEMEGDFAKCLSI